ncbi:MAG: DUF2568 domain-containing protein [Gordonia sp. (in: high G+C Gram-positive bacteria)]|uniref:DUF2568 domain-containing protein n=1 Tax=Gordonia sp. (in: high G+C Gram-positive bacteria) TaxID=84139 RepID=UPI0039E525C5
MATAEAITPNDVLAFVVEVVAFVALGIWAWRLGDSTVVSLGWVVLVVGAAAVLWGLFVAPKAPIHQPLLEVVLRVAILGAGVAALSTLVGPAVWVPVAAVDAVNTLLLYVGPLRR